MPRYELLLISRKLAKDGLQSLLKRTCDFIFDQDGIVRKIENLGEQELPYRMKAHTEWHTHGQYFLLDIHMKTQSLPPFKKELKFDFDVIRPTLIKAFSDFDHIEKKKPQIFQCGKSYQPPYGSRN